MYFFSLKLIFFIGLQTVLISSQSTIPENEPLESPINLFQKEENDDLQDTNIDNTPMANNHEAALGTFSSNGDFFTETTQLNDLNFKKSDNAMTTQNYDLSNENPTENLLSPKTVPYISPELDKTTRSIFNQDAEFKQRYYPQTYLRPSHKKKQRKVFNRSNEVSVTTQINEPIFPNKLQNEIDENVTIKSIFKNKHEISSKESVEIFNKQINVIPKPTRHIDEESVTAQINEPTLPNTFKTETNENVTAKSLIENKQEVSTKGSFEIVKKQVNITPKSKSQLMKNLKKFLLLVAKRQKFNALVRKYYVVTDKNISLADNLVIHTIPFSKKHELTNMNENDFKTIKTTLQCLRPKAVEFWSFEFRNKKSNPNKDYIKIPNSKDVFKYEKISLLDFIINLNTNETYHNNNKVALDKKGTLTKKCKTSSLQTFSLYIKPSLKNAAYDQNDHIWNKNLDTQGFFNGQNIQCKDIQINEQPYKNPKPLLKNKPKKALTISIYKPNIFVLFDLFKNSNPNAEMSQNPSRHSLTDDTPKLIHTKQTFPLKQDNFEKKYSYSNNLPLFSPHLTNKNQQNIFSSYKPDKPNFQHSKSTFDEADIQY